MNGKGRESDFECLIAQARACRTCDRMHSSQRVIGRSSGRINASVMFVGEAPGRLGADSSAIPFHGDKAGENFESLLEQVGLSRYDCFITNAALCNPKDEKGNNATPSRRELENCAHFLKQQIDLVDPRIVVSLGGQALIALSFVAPHSISLSEGVRKKWEWYGRLLIPLYHPGQRAMIHRSFFNQLVDYRFVSETVRKLSGKRKTRSTTKPTAALIASIVRALLSASGPISYFSLHKLFCLLGYEHYRRRHCRLTNCYIIRQKDGPYVVELNIKKVRKALPELKVWNEKNKLMLSLGGDLPLLPDLRQTLISDDPILEDLLSMTVQRYASRTDNDLKRIVYLTGPMRHILRREKYRREDMFNAPIDFSVIAV